METWRRETGRGRRIPSPCFRLRPSPFVSNRSLAVSTSIPGRRFPSGLAGEIARIILRGGKVSTSRGLIERRKQRPETRDGDEKKTEEYSERREGSSLSRSHILAETERRRREERSRDGGETGDRRGNGTLVKPFTKPAVQGLVNCFTRA